VNLTSRQAVHGVNRASHQEILSPSRTGVILGAATVMGAALRLHSLSTRSLWIDEAASISFASMPWRPFLRTLWDYQGNMALYYFSLRAWIHLGDTEFVVRSLSVLFAVLTLPAIYFLGARLFDRATGLTAAALLSVHSFHVHWSQEARGYSLLTLLLVLAAYFLVAAMESGEGGYWIAFAVTAALSFYAHIFAVFVLAAFAVSIAIPKPFRVETRTIALVAILFEHLAAPMALFVLVHHAGSQIAWLPRPSPGEVWAFLLLLTGQGGIGLLAIYLLLVGMAFVRQDEADEWEKEKWAVRLLFLWLVLPPLLTLAATPVKPLFYARYMVMCVPAIVLLAARGVTRLYKMAAARPWAPVAALLLATTLSGWGTYRYFVNLPQESTDWRAAVSYILQHQQPGDGVVIYRAHALCYRYYADQSEREHKIAAAPDVLYPSGRPLTREEISNATAARGRVWLLLHDERDSPNELNVIQSALAESFQPKEKSVFPGEIEINVVLYERLSAGR
jgi:mannosyltransferase